MKAKTYITNLSFDEFKGVFDKRSFSLIYTTGITYRGRPYVEFSFPRFTPRFYLRYLNKNQIKATERKTPFYLICFICGIFFGFMFLVCILSFFLNDKEFGNVYASVFSSALTTLLILMPIRLRKNLWKKVDKIMKSDFNCRK